jgi:hypothetical protein
MKPVSAYLADPAPKPDVMRELGPHYTETKTFRAYAAAIRLFIEQQGSVTTRQIHERFGYDLQHLTLPALSWIGTEESKVLPTRYSLKTKQVRDVHGEEYSRRMANIEQPGKRSKKFKV